MALLIGLLSRNAPCQSSVDLAAQGSRKFEQADSAPGKSIFSADDQKFLDDLEHRGIDYFVDEADPVTGLMPDRAKAARRRRKDVASIASVGFRFDRAVHRR